MQHKIKVSIVGINGIPAKYGGYETLADNLTRTLLNQYDFIVFCSAIHDKKIKSHNSARLIRIPLKANGWQSLIYDIYTLFYAAIKSDIILYLGPGAGFILPIVKLINKNIIVNHGGLNEWEREKYSKFQRTIARIGHKYGARFCKINIADNFILQDSLNRNFNADSVVIRYGGNHVVKPELNTFLLEKYRFLNSEYYVNVSRAQIDNNLHLVLEAFEKIPNLTLVIVSNWSISTYGKNLREKYSNNFENIILLDAIYDLIEINAIRAYAKVYIHSHSYCGTSPSLVEAMYLGLPIFSFDVPTNRETTQDKAFYFKTKEQLIESLCSAGDEELRNCGNLMKQIADKEYTWDFVGEKYAEIFNKLTMI